MSHARRSFAFAALFFTAMAANAQFYRMMQSTDIGWFQDIDPVACTDTGGFTHWNSRSLTFHLNPQGQGAGKEDAIKGALTEWSTVSASDFTLGWGGTKSPNGYEQSDGYNMIIWDTDPLCDSLSCHAITALLLGSGQVITEADILFNANPNRSFQWMINQSSPNCWQTPGSQNLMIDTQGIATHELGHALGIDHPTNFNSPSVTSTMSRIACTPAAQTIEIDDKSALRCGVNRYPHNPNYQGSLDVATCSSFFGWAMNASHSYETSYVEFVEKLSSGVLKVVAVVPAGGTGHTFSWDPPFNDGKKHTIRTRYSGGTQASLAADKDLYCDVPLFPDTLQPTQDLPTNGVAYEVATQFSSSVNGKITALGYNFAPGETGSHLIRLLSDTGTELASTTISPSMASYRYGSITPVSIQAGVLYRVAITTFTEQSKTPCSLPYTNGPLTAHQGFWKQNAGGLPNTGSCSNFHVSIRFEM